MSLAVKFGSWLGFCVFAMMVIQLSLCKHLNNFAGPYWVRMLQANNKSDEFKSNGKMWINVYFSPPRPGEHRQYLYGSSYNAMPLDDTIRIDVTIAKRSNNQWKKNAFVMKFDRACETLNKHAKMFLPMFFGDDGKGCPVPAGFRVIRNTSFEVYYPEFPVFPYGRWLFTALLYKSKDLVMILNLDHETVPQL